MINWLKNRPKIIFLIDGIGAVITAVLLLLILFKFQSSFGMPEKPILYLSGIALFYAFSSLSFYFKTTENIIPYIKYMVIANTLYCLLSAVFVYYNFSALTSLGLGYFSVEIFVIMILVGIEWSLVSSIEMNES